MTDNNPHTANNSSFPPSDWMETTLGEVCEINPTESLPKGKIAKAVPMDCIDSFTRQISRFEEKEFQGGMKFRNGDTLLARITPCLENGKTAFVDFLDENEVGFGSTEYIVIREKQRLSDKKFLYYLVISPNFREIAIKAMTGTSGRQRVQTDVLVNKLLLLPPLPEQQAIASVLSAFDDKIELLREQNKTLEEMGQVIFQEWFGKYGVDDELPEGWRVGKLGEVGQQITERVKNQQNRQVLSAVNTGNLVLSQDYFTKQVFSKTLEKYIICEPGDFSYNPARINIGSIGRNNNNILGAVSPVYVVFRPNMKIGRYLEFILKSKDFNKHVEKFANGSVRQALNYDGFSRFEILIPSDQILDEFNEIIFDFDQKINSNNSQIQSLARSRDELLPRLMRGEVRVKGF